MIDEHVKVYSPLGVFSADASRVFRTWRGQGAPFGRPGRKMLATVGNYFGRRVDGKVSPRLGSTQFSRGFP